MMILEMARRKRGGSNAYPQSHGRWSGNRVICRVRRVKVKEGIAYIRDRLQGCFYCAVLVPCDAVNKVASVLP
jgi:hypothetical protein